MVKTINGNGVRFLGMNLGCYHEDANVKYRFLPQKLLHERLKHFQILKYVFCTFSIYVRYFTFVSIPLVRGRRDDC